jgi:hypothetical protein
LLSVWLRREFPIGLRFFPSLPIYLFLVSFLATFLSTFLLSVDVALFEALFFAEL